MSRVFCLDLSYDCSRGSARRFVSLDQSERPKNCRPDYLRLRFFASSIPPSCPCLFWLLRLPGLKVSFVVAAELGSSGSGAPLLVPLPVKLVGVTGEWFANLSPHLISPLHESSTRPFSYSSRTRRAGPVRVCVELWNHGTTTIGTVLSMIQSPSL